MSFHDNKPRVFWKGEFLRICGNSFWSNNDGADMFCKKLGYEYGVIRTTDGQSTSEERSFFVGLCREDHTSLIDCFGYDGEFKIHSFKECTKGRTYDIICSGGNAINAWKESCIVPGKRKFLLYLLHLNDNFKFALIKF